MYLSYLGPGSWFFHIRSSSVLTVGSGWSLMAAGWLPGCSQGLEIHIWRAGICDNWDILVYWYGRNIPFLNTNRSRLSCWQKNILSISHTMSFPGGQKESSLKTTTCGTYHLLPAGPLSDSHAVRCPGSGWWGPGRPCGIRPGWLRAVVKTAGQPCILANTWVLSTQPPFYGAQQEKLLVGVPGRKTCFSPEPLIFLPFFWWPGIFQCFIVFYI